MLVWVRDLVGLGSDGDMVELGWGFGCIGYLVCWIFSWTGHLVGLGWAVLEF